MRENTKVGNPFGSQKYTGKINVERQKGAEVNRLHLECQITMMRNRKEMMNYNLLLLPVVLIPGINKEKERESENDKE